MLIYENKIGVNLALDEQAECYPHLHHHFELVFIYDGETNIKVGSQKCSPTKNSVIITFPNQIHSYEMSKYNMSYILVYSPDEYPEFKDIFNFKTPKTPVIFNASNDIKVLFETIIEIHRSGHPHKDALERGYMLVLLSNLFNNMEFINQNSFNLSSMQNILLYCDSNYTSDISLEKISEELYISKTYISRIFNEKIKIGFSDYINEHRIQDAAHQLKRTTKSISEIAYGVGYNNIRSFNRQFIIKLGITPNEYRKANQTITEIRQ